MIALPLIFLSGLLGSVHCLGMCGGLAAAVGSRAATPRGNLARQAAFTLGRIGVYAGGGAMAGFGGARLATNYRWLIDVQAALAIVAGLLLLHEGLRALGFVVRRPLSVGGLPCATAGRLRTLLAAPGAATALAGGVLTGFLPCGLVYAYLAVAASTGSIPRGAAVMIAMGLGTAPLMVAAGLGFHHLSLRWRRAALRMAGGAVVVVGLMSLARGGVAFAQRSLAPASPAAAPACPLCTEQSLPMP